MSDPIDITTPAAFEQACAEADSQLGGLDADIVPPDAQITATLIGEIDRNIDGKDVYFLLTRHDDDLTPEQAHNWLLPQVFKPCRGVGQHYIDTVTAVQAADSTDQVICTVQERCDV